MVYAGDVRKVIAEFGGHILEEWSPQLIMTSPPYAQSKPYEQGLTYDGLWKLILETAQACFDIARPGAFFCINFGETTKYDKFPASRVAPDGSCDLTMSHLYTVTMKMAGWRIHSRRVWKKCFPKIRASAYNHTMRIPVAEFENIWTWRKPGGDRETKPDSKLHMRAVWDTGEERKEHAGRGKYKAAYPLIIPRKAIQIFTEEGDFVFDPFAGSGTTALAAGLLGRHSVSCEKFKDYIPVIREKLAVLRDKGHHIWVDERPYAEVLPR